MSAFIKKCQDDTPVANQPVYLTDDTIEKAIATTYTINDSFAETWRFLRKKTPFGHDFGQCKVAFLYILEKLLREEKVKFIKDGKVLEESIAERLQKFIDIFPDQADQDELAKDIDNLYWWGYYMPVDNFVWFDQAGKPLPDPHTGELELED